MRYEAKIVLPNGYEQKVSSYVRGGRRFDDFRSEQAAIKAAKRYCFPQGFIIVSELCHE